MKRMTIQKISNSHSEAFQIAAEMGIECGEIL